MDKHIVFFFFCSSRLSSTTASSNVWKQLQMHLQEMYPTYRAHRVDSSWWPRWHFHRLQGCSRQTCSLSPPCKSLHEWKASLVSCGGPEYLEGTYTMVQRSTWKVVKLYLNENHVARWSVFNVQVIQNSIRRQEFYSNFSEHVSYPHWNQIRFRLRLPLKTQKIPLKYTSEAKRMFLCQSLMFLPSQNQRSGAFPNCSPRCAEQMVQRQFWCPLLCCLCAPPPPCSICGMV